MRDLGQGLILRRGTAADAEALAAFNADHLRGQDAAEPSPGLAAWTLDLMRGRHPTFVPADATIVEDTARGRIVSAAMLISHTWSFGGVRLPVGQPELIATDPEYRGRGLVRTQVEVLHRWSAERGHRVLFISGIPGFYHQFGYTYALGRGGGPRLAAGVAMVPRPDEEPYRLRPARVDDAGFCAQVDAHAARRYFVTVPRNVALWAREIAGHHPRSAVRQDALIIETRGGEPVGFLLHGQRLYGSSFPVTGFELKAGVSWQAVWRAVLAHCRMAAEALVARDGGRFEAVGFWFLGRAHPVNDIYPFMERPRARALYVRVPDLADVVRALAPVLEARLAASAVVGHSGELRLGFYADGLRLRFEGGSLKAAEAWRPARDVVGQEDGAPSSEPRRPDALFPGRTFLPLLFGHRALAELEAAFEDCIVRTPEARALLQALLPPRPSDVWPVL